MTNTPLELPADLDLGQLIFEQADDLRSPLPDPIGARENQNWFILTVSSVGKKARPFCSA